MSSCSTIYEHPEFRRSFNSNNRRHSGETEKLKRYLVAAQGHFAGEQLKGDLWPFKSFPRGRSDTRILFLLCKDCRQKVMRNPCSFCNLETHSLNDAVLFLIGSHKFVYGRNGKKILLKLRRKS